MPFSLHPALETHTAVSASRLLCATYELKLLPAAATVAALALERCNPFRIFTDLGTILRFLRRHTRTRLVCALLPFVRHRSIPLIREALSYALYDSAKPPQDAPFPRRPLSHVKSTTRSQQMLRVLQTCLRQLFPTQHPRNLPHPLPILHPPHFCTRSPAFFALLNQEVLVRQMLQFEEDA